MLRQIVRVSLIGFLLFLGTQPVTAQPGDIQVTASADGVEADTITIEAE